MTRPQIRRKLACERNSAAEDLGNIANAAIESTAAQGRRRLALAVVVGFGGGEEVDYVEEAGLRLRSPFTALPASPLPPQRHPPRRRVVAALLASGSISENIRKPRGCHYLHMDYLHPKNHLRLLYL